MLPIINTLFVSFGVTSSTTTVLRNQNYQRYTAFPGHSCSVLSNQALAKAAQNQRCEINLLHKRQVLISVIVFFVTPTKPKPEKRSALGTFPPPNVLVLEHPAMWVRFKKSANGVTTQGASKLATHRPRVLLDADAARVRCRARQASSARRWPKRRRMCDACALA